MTTNNSSMNNRSTNMTTNLIYSNVCYNEPLKLSFFSESSQEIGNDRLNSQMNNTFRNEVSQGLI